jgi:hypothetical protein
MCCYLEEYRARVCTWAARVSWRAAVGHVGMSGGAACVGQMILCSTVLAALLIIGGGGAKPWTYGKHGSSHM